LKRTLSFNAISAVLLGSLAWGQAGHSVPLAAVGPELPYTEALTPPMPVSGLQMPLMFSSETPRSNFVIGSVELGAAYDDNVLATASGHISDVSYLILPTILIGQTRERWNWDFAYSPGFTINQRVAQRNQAAHNLYLLFDYRLTPHVNAQIREGFEKSNTLFSGLLGGTPAGAPGPLQQPNTSVITPFADRTANNSGLDLTYQFSASSLVGASGNFYFVNYAAPENSRVPSYALIDSHAWGGNAFYAHRFTNGQWAGVTHNFQRLLFDTGPRTDVNRTFLFYSLPVGSLATLSVWAGPEYSTTLVANLSTAASSLISHDHWDAAGGADLSWEAKKTSFRVGYTRQTTDGGGLSQAVNLQQVNGEVRERLTTRWTASVGVGYGKNKPLNVPSGTAFYRTWNGNAGLNYSFTDNLDLGLRYGRDQLQYGYNSASNRNRAWVTVSYSFSRPLGR
jgi:hypothetical protein